MIDSGARNQLIERLRLDAARIADHFGLDLRAVEPEHPRVKSRYGVCYETGLIKIRLYHAKTGKPLKYSSLVDTLCHELAHLRHFDHGPSFKSFFLQLLGWARQQGIYRPAPRRYRGPAGPRREPAELYRLERRNGVPVFGSFTDSSRRWPPRARQAPPPVIAPESPAPALPRAEPPRRAARRGEAPARPQQLSLFSD